MAKNAESAGTDLFAEIEKQARGLAAEEVTRNSLPVTVFTSEFGGRLGQLREDKEALVAAGFDWDKVEMYEALLRMLTDSQGKAVNSRDRWREEYAVWMQRKTEAEGIRGRLLAGGRFVADGDARAESIIREIAEGASNMDLLQDIKSLAEFAESRKKEFAELTIGGERLTAEYPRGES